ncbi:hypothetical protein NP233_g7985 [Leucocoprinus birnbaumii]|uniref:Uncharacterized protein n=1 Tax=Leucocoprinus birnbaumii TaxID=56174 RepID=A0AAD5VNB1_9AGAR|nr:hypothetical protein NP233_g7985 [Leucocoprinus birnbaumii]
MFYLYTLFTLIAAASILYVAYKMRCSRPEKLLWRSNGLGKLHASIYLNVILAITVIILLASNFSALERVQRNHGITGIGGIADYEIVLLLVFSLILVHIAVTVKNARKSCIAQEPAEEGASIDRKVQYFEVPKLWNENKTARGNEFAMSNDDSATLFNDRFSEFDALSEGKGSNTSNKGGQGNSDSFGLKILSTTQFTTNGCTADIENRITVSRS